MRKSAVCTTGDGMGMSFILGDMEFLYVLVLIGAVLWILLTD